MMKKLCSIGFASAVVATSMFGVTTSASAHEPYYRDALSAQCEAPGVMKHISRRFAHQAKHLHHRDEWRIDSITHVHQHRYLPQDVHKSRPIPRRYCHGTVQFNDGSQRKVWYLIEGGMGFAGFGRNEIEFCIDGLDPLNVYNRNCSILR